jgi:hypothetical protein
VACEVIKTPLGAGVMCFRGVRPRRCRACKTGVAAYLCDHPTGRACSTCKARRAASADLATCEDCGGTGKATCSAPLCDGCRSHAEEGLDLCPEHKAARERLPGPEPTGARYLRREDLTPENQGAAVLVRFLIADELERWAPGTLAGWDRAGNVFVAFGEPARIMVATARRKCTASRSSACGGPRPPNSIGECAPRAMSPSA